uniref:Meiotic nuclear division protein 1 homolog n=1 Tax=Phallusia mammillata TaxID=59560 RepID=A0A6F9DRE6_9ASCI|nr:meiotic nuclear division protein 1 homolog [Phallusia mammillata]
MSKKRGLSLEEKRKRMLDIFFEKKEFFHLKELEKIAPKEKGITPMSVKDVVQSLVDDGMVNCEKVGSSSYYWAFPSQAFNVRLNKRKNLEEQIDQNKEKRLKTDEMKKNSLADRKPTAEREKLLAMVAKLQDKKNQLQTEISKYDDCNPDVMNRLIAETTMSKDAANRWTDNLFTLKSWLKRKFPIPEQQINKQFCIPEELDYIE